MKKIPLFIIIFLIFPCIAVFADTSIKAEVNKLKISTDSIKIKSKIHLEYKPSLPKQSEPETKEPQVTL